MAVWAPPRGLPTPYRTTTAHTLPPLIHLSTLTGRGSIPPTPPPRQFHLAAVPTLRQVEATSASGRRYRELLYTLELAELNYDLVLRATATIWVGTTHLASSGSMQLKHNLIMYIGLN